jgi:hypothetical protein
MRKGGGRLVLGAGCRELAENVGAGSVGARTRLGLGAYGAGSIVAAPGG